MCIYFWEIQKRFYQNSQHSPTRITGSSFGSTCGLFSATGTELRFERVVFWTDSMITLNYIYSQSRRCQTYVANRVTEIRELTAPEQWRHCPGKLNPAGDVSRGLEMKEFQNNERWLREYIPSLQERQKWNQVP